MNNNSTLKVLVDGIFFSFLYSIIIGINSVFHLNMSGIAMIITSIVLWAVLSIVTKNIISNIKEKVVAKKEKNIL